MQDDGWRVVAARHRPAIRSTLRAQAGGGLEVDFVPSVEALLDDPDATLYISGAPGDRSSHRFAVYKAFNAARFWDSSANFDDVDIALRTGEMVLIPSLSDPDLAAFLRDPENYYLSGRALDWLQEEYVRSVGEAAKLASSAERKYTSAVKGVAQLVGGLENLSKLIDGDDINPEKARKALSRGLASVRRLADSIAERLKGL